MREQRFKKVVTVDNHDCIGSEGILVLFSLHRISRFLDSSSERKNVCCNLILLSIAFPLRSYYFFLLYIFYYSHSQTPQLVCHNPHLARNVHHDFQSTQTNRQLPLTVSTGNFRLRIVVRISDQRPTQIQCNARF